MEESPLHPFELHNYIPMSLGGVDISINKAVVIMWVVVALVAALMVMAGSARKLVPGKLQSMAEMMVDFIRGIIMDTMGKEGMRFFPLIATLFLFILFCNLVGMIPGSYTVTSQIVVTATFALTVYGMSIILGFALHGVKFLTILVPGGTPVWMLPLMVPIELISQLARPISLAVRLFANMTAGHTILTVLFGMVISLSISVPLPIRVSLLILLVLAIASKRQIISKAGMLGIIGLSVFIPVALTVVWAGWIPFAATLFVNGLEIALIAPIQAYIFTVLTCVYLGDAFHLHGHDDHAH
jgi:F-type H+-transporting ATPase subunit a